MKHLNCVILILLASTCCLAQSSRSFDLQQLLKEKKLITVGQKIVSITDSGKKGISMTSVAWLDGVEFSTGTIDVDLRGKDIFQRSFLGIAFHGVDTAAYDVVYFRPFNFRAADPVRKIHAVQYATHPEFPWHRLREERNGIYEKAIDPAPEATSWFHARIVVTNDEITVYVNNSSTPSLKVNKLNTRKSGKIGLWSDALDSDFANLVITK